MGKVWLKASMQCAVKIRNAPPKRAVDVDSVMFFRRQMQQYFEFFKQLKVFSGKGKEWTC